METGGATEKVNGGGVRERIEVIRRLMREDGLHAIIVRSTDRFLNEYVPASESTRVWATGFTGSMGDAVLGLEAGWVAVDGRYYLQAEQQLDARLLAVEKVPFGKSIEDSVAHLVRSIATAPIRVGYEPDRFGVRDLEALEKSVKDAPITLVPTRPSLVERARAVLSGGAAAAPHARPVRAIDEAKVGRTVAQKLEEAAKALDQARVVRFLVQRLDEIAYLTNLRGDDLPYQATFRSLALLAPDHVLLAADPAAFPEAVRAARGDLVRIVPEDRWIDMVRALGEKARIGYDPAGTTAAALADLRAAGAEPVALASPLAGMKARKTKHELAVMLSAFRRADAVVSRAARWLNGHVAKDERVTEKTFADQVERLFRRSGATGLSFKVISAAGKNGAVIHYSDPDPERAVQAGELMLLDTGAYYEEGYATDLTRTFLVGSPRARATDEQRRLFTLVLKCAIAGMSARVPEGTRGDQLDAICRAPLWKHGLAYNHGTGHGVGINVHEFPPRIGPQGTAVLEPGHVFSIEPGVYLPEFGGIRIENLCTIEPAGGVPGFLDVKPLTFSPLDDRLIERKLLTRDETLWLKDYKRKGRDAATEVRKAPRRALLASAGAATGEASGDGDGHARAAAASGDSSREG